MLARRSIDKPTEDEIARAASDLLTRAGKGPGKPDGDLNPQDLRAAALTRATTSEDAKAAWPGTGASEDPADVYLAGTRAGVREHDEEPDDNDDEEGQLAPVIPLGVFDAAKEAKKRW
jgi:putative transposase